MTAASVPETIVVEPGALADLAAHAVEHRWRDALLIMDTSTEEAAGAELSRELEGAGVRARALRFLHGTLADERAVAKARGRLRAEQPDGVVAVGSGVITDVTRYACHAEGRDFVSAPTAASMDGYASSVAAMEFGGVKVTLPARAPRAIFADPEIVAAAPAQLTRAGLGDLLGKATARVDWLAAHLLCGEPFAAEIDARVLASLTYAVARARAILAGQQEAVRGLLGGLIESGLAIAAAGSSRPASGCEHHASHFWDLLAARGAREHGSHGLQVGYATQWAMRLQRYAFAGGVAEVAAPLADGATDDEDARAWLDPSIPALVEAAAEKRSFLSDHAAAFPAGGEEWAAARGALADPLALFDGVERALTEAGLPPEPGVMRLDARTLRATFRHARRLRARYTVLDFLAGQDALERAIDAVLPR